EVSMRGSHACVAALGVALVGAQPLRAQGTIELTVIAGRPLRVALDRRVRITEVGQPIEATVVQPVYAYDRIVVPIGTHVLGRISAIEPLSKPARLRAILAGDLTPAHHI